MRQVVAVRRLRQYIGRQVLVTTTHEDQHTGRLEHADAGGIELAEVAVMHNGRREPIKGRVVIPAGAVMFVQVV